MEGHPFRSFFARTAPSRSPRLLGIGALWLIAVAASSAGNADDSPSMRYLARRYYAPTRFFQPGENDVPINHVVVPQKMFLVPIEAQQPARLAIDEPAFLNAAPEPLHIDASPLIAATQTAISQAAITQAPVMQIPAAQAGVTRVASASVPAAPPAPPADMSNQPEPLVAPEPLDIDTVALAVVAEQPLPPPAPPADSTGNPSGSFANVEKLGDAPQSNTLQFLRTQAILLTPGQSQFDYGLNYSIFDARAAVPVVSGGTVVGVANVRDELRLMTVPLAWRYGVADGLQTYVNVPLGWSNTAVTTDAGTSTTNNFGGVGDISAGISYQICKSCGPYSPDVIATLGFIAPTGHATFATSLLTPSSVLGQGFWQITSNILCVHTMDPLVLYYGGGYVHRFDADIQGIDVNPGQEIDYLMGVGFAVNPWVTLSGSVIGAYLTTYKADGTFIPGSDRDIIRFRFSATIVKGKHICEPFAEIAMTPDSPSRVGVTFTY